MNKKDEGPTSGFDFVVFLFFIFQMNEHGLLNGRTLDEMQTELLCYEFRFRQEALVAEFFRPTSFLEYEQTSAIRYSICDDMM